MRFRGILLAPVFIVLICGYSLVGIYHFQKDLRSEYKAQNSYWPQQLIAKYAPLGPFLPQGEVIRFLIDENHSDSKIAHPNARLFLAQYAISPRLLNFDAESSWVIVDSDCPGSVPDIATSSHWTLVADIRNGVRLYRTDKRE
jgi:hypothetical protein